MILMQTTPRPLSEAPKDDPLADPKPAAGDDPAAKPEDGDGKPKDDAGTDKGSGASPPDDPESFNFDDDEEEDDDETGGDGGTPGDDGLGGGDAATDPSDTSPDGGSDPAAEQIAREQLYDAIVDMQSNCDSLSQSAATLIDSIKDPVAQKLAIRAKQMIDDTSSQCEVIRSRFLDLGYERVRDVYVTVRERVSAVAEIIKHVIDGDDDFRKPDSGPT